MTLNLTPEEWEALAETLASERELDPDNYIATALDKVLAHRPKPVLEDGKYLTPVGSLVFVEGGRYFHNAFDLGGGGNPLPDDVSGWTRLRVLADDEVAVYRGSVDYAAEACEETLRTATAKYLRDLLAESDR